jgi:hypothetical protein
MDVGIGSVSCPGHFTLGERAPGYPWNKSWISSRAGLILRREIWEQSRIFLIPLVSKDVVNNVRYWLTWSDVLEDLVPHQSGEKFESHIETPLVFSPEHDYDPLVFPASGRVTVMTTQVVFFCRVQVECDCNYFVTEGLSTSVSHFQINFFNFTHLTKIFTVSSSLHN